MKVKIGKIIYDSDKEPIILDLDKKEKYQIANMSDTQNIFLSYPEDVLQKDAERFLGEYKQQTEEEYIKMPNLNPLPPKEAPGE